MAGVKCFAVLNVLLLVSLLGCTIRVMGLDLDEAATAIQAASFDLELEVELDLEAEQEAGSDVDVVSSEIGTSEVSRRLLSHRKKKHRKGAWEKKNVLKKKKRKGLKKKKRVPLKSLKKKKPSLKKIKKPVPKAPRWKKSVPKPVSNPPQVSYGGGKNPIDSCWMGPNWAADRKKLANCAIGFGANAIGGRDGSFYVVTDPGDDCVNPAPGTLRYGAVQLQALWITFAYDMDIKLKNELLITSYKTIDGRGKKVTIGHGGPCLTIQYVEHVIIESLTIVDCVPGHSGDVISSTAHTGYRGGSDGDAISVFGSTNVWIDHCTLTHAYDGLIDVIHASTLVTISNNYFSDHDKVMLLGHNDAFTADKIMKVTIAYNTFGPNLIQRMPRCRLGQFHVINNDYPDGWGIYAIGGSGNPTILSEGNRFVAGGAKQVTKREDSSGTGWSWHSSNDLFLNGAYFSQSGGYGGSVLRTAASGVAMAFSPSLTARSGALVAP